jgi:hypothetical protein
VRLVLSVWAVLVLAGCSIEKFNAPPAWASVVITHARFYGLDAEIPLTSGQSVVKVKLGWGSETWTVLPASTNQVFVPKISDTFSVGQSLNPFDTTIKEYLQTSWEGQNLPPPAMQLFTPPHAWPKPLVLTNAPAK